MLENAYYSVKRKCLKLLYGKRRGTVIPESKTPQENWFGDHYDDWRARRIEYILANVDSDFSDKTVLELGCGHGQIGAEFLERGATVVFNDARKIHLDVVQERYHRFGPRLRTVTCDLDAGFPEGQYDLVLHLGVLYHLHSCEKSIRRACAATNELVLETEVADSSDPFYQVQVREEGYDQAFGKIGTRPSGAFVERVLRDCGFDAAMLRTSACNSGVHVYDWEVKETGAWKHGLRRLWICRRAQSA